MVRGSRKLQRPRSLTDLVVQRIRSQIIEGGLEFGEFLSENALADAYGVSKTPVREALLQLKQEGLIDIQSKRGCYVFRLDPPDFEAVCELRTILEAAALDLAISRSHARLVADLSDIVGKMDSVLAADDFAGYRRLDADFHTTLFRHSGNHLLEASYQPIAFKVQAIRTRLSVGGQHNETSMSEHRAILEAIRQRHVTQARELIVAHVRHTQRRYAEEFPVAAPPADRAGTLAGGRRIA